MRCARSQAADGRNEVAALYAVCYFNPSFHGGCERGWPNRLAQFIEPSQSPP